MLISSWARYCQLWYRMWYTRLVFHQHVWSTFLIPYTFCVHNVGIYVLNISCLTTDEMIKCILCLVLPTVLLFSYNLEVTYVTKVIECYFMRHSLGSSLTFFTVSLALCVGVWLGMCAGVCACVCVWVWYIGISSLTSLWLFICQSLPLLMYECLCLMWDFGQKCSVSLSILILQVPQNYFRSCHIQVLHTSLLLHTVVFTPVVDMFQANEMLQAAKSSQSPTERRHHLIEALRVGVLMQLSFY